MAGNGDDEPEERTPLDDLSRSIEERRQVRKKDEPVQDDDIWATVREESEGDGEAWSNVVMKGEYDPPEHEADTVGTDAMGSAARSGIADGPKGWLPEYPSTSVFIIHGISTGIVLLLSLLVYVSAVFSLIPRHFWILSLPLLALALFGIAPMMAWYMGIWNPKESI